MAVFTAGFAETGQDEGLKLQEAIVEMANAAGMPIVGPNCMGVYNRRRGVKFHADVDQNGDGGNVSIVGQSGTHTINMTTAAQRAGIRVGRGISIGNAVVVNEADYLEYLRDDPETEVIGMYLEGLKDGRRFFKALRETTPNKPVVIWKGGQTSAGQRATRSHTGLAGDGLGDLGRDDQADRRDPGDQRRRGDRRHPGAGALRAAAGTPPGADGDDRRAVRGDLGRLRARRPRGAGAGGQLLRAAGRVLQRDRRLLPQPVRHGEHDRACGRRGQPAQDDGHPRRGPEHRRHGLRVHGELLRALLEGRAGAVRRDDADPGRFPHAHWPAAGDGDAPRPQGRGRDPAARRRDRPRLRGLPVPSTAPLSPSRAWSRTGSGSRRG